MAPRIPPVDPRIPPADPCIPTADNVITYMEGGKLAKLGYTPEPSLLLFANLTSGGNALEDDASTRSMVGKVEVKGNVTCMYFFFSFLLQCY